MSRPSPQTIARQTMVALIREARVAGWARVKGEIKPDGTVTLDADTTELDASDDFLNGDLRMSGE